MNETIVWKRNRTSNRPRRAQNETMSSANRVFGTTVLPAVFQSASKTRSLQHTLGRPGLSLRQHRGNCENIVCSVLIKINERNDGAVSRSPIVVRRCRFRATRASVDVMCFELVVDDDDGFDVCCCCPCPANRRLFGLFTAFAFLHAPG